VSQEAAAYYQGESFLIIIGSKMEIMGVSVKRPLKARFGACKVSETVSEMANWCSKRFSNSDFWIGK